MTTTTTAPAFHATDETATAQTHRVVFSDPDAATATAVGDTDTRGAAQAPVFSSPY
ncbi:hypothetical protein [Arthrobacter sp. NicSoilB8]|uniref:hypothetical protein n=1 Tax=Arthrobacter sp. NicSoilB8 TaxID=2830998 RepID=UPI001CC6F9E9|nr:hypothetical protein [Arthrobacter sp. NicSoilB8]BCW70868.1 hypothetical protein NicSoilB8_19120 [Arthrobacter sp. NicSoilB8]